MKTHKMRTVATNLGENTRVPEKVELVDWGVIDQKGRRVGCIVSTWVEERISQAVGGDWQRWDLDPGTHFAFAPAATRDGKPYGSGGMERYFPTEDARDTAILVYLRAAQRRAAKLGDRQGDVTVTDRTPGKA